MSAYIEQNKNKAAQAPNDETSLGTTSENELVDTASEDEGLNPVEGSETSIIDSNAITSSSSEDTIPQSTEIVNGENQSISERLRQ